MRRPESHFRSNRRIRSGIFYFLCLMLLLECAKRAAPGWGIGQPVVAGPDTTFTWLPDSLASPGLSQEARPPENFAVKEQLMDTPAARTPSPDATAGNPRGLHPGTGWERRPGSSQSTATAVRDLNRVGAAELQAVRGIGPVLSARIVKFREALGGFQHAGQLLDVYGLPPEVARRAARQFRVEHPPPVRRIDINTASVEELAALVYLDWQMARDIVARRDTLGPYKSLEDLRAIGSIPNGRFERIALYLSLEKQ